MKMTIEESWSEDDELHIKELESLVKQVWAIAEHESDKETIHKMSDLSFFLKTLKPQLKHEWSEEDKRIVTRIVESLSAYANKLQYEGFCHNSEVLYEQINWLKSLKDIYTWKPSDKQIEALDFAVDCIVPAEFCFKRKELKGLLEQLKKLKE